MVIDIQQLSTDDYDNSSYLAQTGAQKDFDIYNGGWSADYLDPSSYLNILNVNNGDVAKRSRPGEVNDKAKGSWSGYLHSNARRSRTIGQNQQNVMKIWKFKLGVDSALAIQTFLRGEVPTLKEQFHCHRHSHKLKIRCRQPHTLKLKIRFCNG